MGRNRFVRPDVVRLSLSDGDWIDVKKELNAGERRQVFADIVKEHRMGETAQLDDEKLGFARMAQYIVDWSFADDGKPVKFSAAALRNLDIGTYREIDTAISAHEAAADAEQESRKNAPDGGSTSSPTSPSVAG